MVLNPNSSINREELLDLVYPVGSIYISYSSTSPQLLFGGSWTRIQGYFLFAADSSHAAGQTGGEATHTLTQNEIPNYTIPQTSLTGTTNEIYCNKADTSGIISQAITVDNRSYSQSGSSNRWSKFTINASHSHSSGGGGAAHNNMPPYIGVYMWRRTA